MRLLAVSASNFGSYKAVAFYFMDQGLTLVHGATGSGKSTLQDLVPWVLFGQTAKDGNADDIRRWNTEEKVEAECTFETTKVYTVVRIRGKASENDLYWKEGESDEKYRGKDITETQKLINNLLGFDSDVYHTSAYYNEYSPTRNFFDNNAKARRELFEKLVDLSLPTSLTERITIVKRETRKTHTKVTEEFNKATGRREAIARAEENAKRDAASWDETKARALQELTAKSQGFETEKATRIAALETKLAAFNDKQAKDLDDLERQCAKLSLAIEGQDEICPTCRAPKPEVQKRINKLTELSTKHEMLLSQNNPYFDQLEQAQLLENTYNLQIANRKSESNPFNAQLTTYGSQLSALSNELTNLQKDLNGLQHRFDSLEQLSDLTSQLRSRLLKNTIAHVQAETNRYLETYFDAEIRTELALGDSDNLEVSLWKSGHACNYRQLSKGQKGLLRLCFSIAVMKAAANKAGVHFNALFMDEALDGLDTELKIKSYNLFSELEKDHETILVIDHANEFKSLFSNAYHVTLVNDESVLAHE